jgi:hypothetical protein
LVNVYKNNPVYLRRLHGTKSFSPQVRAHAPAIVGAVRQGAGRIPKGRHRHLAAITQELRAAKPDVLIVFANDHLANSRITFYPDFLIGDCARAQRTA